MNARVLIIQPPFVQLNAPYPAPYYLKSYLASRGNDIRGSESDFVDVRVADHSIGLFARIFCRTGLERIFDDARGAFATNGFAVGTVNADQASPVVQIHPDSRATVARFLSESRRWIGTIDRLIAFLRGADHEFSHALSAANGALPSGPRLDRFLENRNGEPDPDDAPLIASLLLADLADFIRVALDPAFYLIRYAESLAASVPRFAEIEAGLGGYILKTFYEPLLAEEWATVGENAGGATANGAPLFVACTIPFPGCLAGALTAAHSAKARFGGRVRVLAGGGYVNTELRSLKAAGFFKYFDYLSFDRGYASLAAILDRETRATAFGDAPPAAPLYKTFFRGFDDVIIGSPDGFPAAVGAIAGSAAGLAAGVETAETARFAAIDEASSAEVFPDYRGVDFSRYIMPVDDINPMHRLWSDGRWLKAYLAHGCYWRSCAFCDVQLDYIRGFAPVNPDALFRHLVSQAEATGVRGVHLTDEAAPRASLLRLAELNRASGLPLLFWGNIRFERGYSADVADVLAAGGMLGVSAGIEVATERGFKRLGKGIDLEDVVHACAGFKEAGLRVHAYLIFGYWDEKPEEIIDSAEILRQMFAAGLLDSAFWHKFVLTRHSRIYAEWRRGKHPELKTIDPPADRDFADNDIRFAGEDESDRFAAPLDALAAAWMAGEALREPVAAAFPFAAPRPTAPSDLIAERLDRYASERDVARQAPLAPSGAEIPPIASGADPTADSRLIFLGSEPVPLHAADGSTRLLWRFKLEDRSLELPDSQAEPVRRLLIDASGAGGLGTRDFAARLSASAGGRKPSERLYRKLRQTGLAAVNMAAIERYR